MASKEIPAPMAPLDPSVCAEHRVSVVVLVFVVPLVPLVRLVLSVCVVKLVRRESKERLAMKVSEATPDLKALAETLVLLVPVALLE